MIKKSPITGADLHSGADAYLGVDRSTAMQAEEPYGENKVSVCGAPSPVSIIKCNVARWLGRVMFPSRASIVTLTTFCMVSFMSRSLRFKFTFTLYNVRAECQQLFYFSFLT